LDCLVHAEKRDLYFARGGTTYYATRVDFDEVVGGLVFFLFFGWLGVELTER